MPNSGLILCVTNRDEGDFGRKTQMKTRLVSIFDSSFETKVSTFETEMLLGPQNNFILFFFGP